MRHASGEFSRSSGFLVMRVKLRDGRFFFFFTFALPRLVCWRWVGIECAGSRCDSAWESNVGKLVERR